MAEAKNSEDKKLVTTKFLANFFKRTERRIQQLTQDKTLPAAKRTKEGNLYDLIPTIQRYICYLQDIVDKRTKSTEEQEKAKLEAEIKYKEAKAEYANLELAELKGKMHRAEDVAALVADLAAKTKSNLSALPGRLAMDIVNKTTASEISAVIEDGINEVLNSLTEYEYNPEYFKERVAEREGWSIDEQGDE